MSPEGRAYLEGILIGVVVVLLVTAFSFAIASLIQ